MAITAAVAEKQVPLVHCAYCASPPALQVRRACMQLVPLITLPGNSSCAHRLLTLLLAKARDKCVVANSALTCLT